ncbi:MAG: peptidoglycan-binding protein [Bacteroidetes bacterium]|nr:peptidoglycan-binding protein [Bacteroidota bacterium]
MSKTTKYIIIAVVIAAIIAAIIIVTGKKANASPNSGSGIGGGSTGSSSGGSSVKVFPLKQGVKSDDVAALQRHLNSKGANLTVDGIFGPKTEAALQLHYGLKEMSEAQFNQFVMTPSSLSNAQIFPLTKGILKNENVLMLQKILNSKGAALDLDGSFGQKTEDALYKYYFIRSLPQSVFEEMVRQYNK